MVGLTFSAKDIRELRRQCLHHNVFPFELGYCMNGEPRRVYAALLPMIDDSVTQLGSMSIAEVKQITESIPAGLRMFIEPIAEPLTPEYLRRVAEYAIAAELQKGYSPVEEVVKPRPHDSEVLSALPEISKLIDDDGLIKLTSDFTLFDGGIRYGEYMLHYHQFLRRGFSSNPNFDFLGTLARYRNETGRNNDFRIAIDHRRLMRHDDYQEIVELDTWFGPAFDPSKLDDPNYVGLTVVGRIYPNSLDSYPIDKTEFLWKRNEGTSIKTLEVEELSSPTKPYDGWHINRYVHAERDMAKHVFCHFDGAAKVYAQANYSSRVQQQMPRHIRCNHYLKLFRIDGKIRLNDWLSLMAMFYKGNEMVVEYFDPEQFNEKIRPMRERHGKATG